MSIESSLFGSNLSNSQYAEFHSLRKSASTMDSLQKQKFNQLIDERLGQFAGRRIKVLSVGSGTGDFDLDIIRFLKERRFRIKKYVCVEPIREHIIDLEKNLKTELSEKQIVIKETTVEKLEMTSKFHLVHNVHVIHWVNKPMDAIKQFETYLKKSGLSVTVLQSEKGMPRVYNELMPALKGNKNGSLTAETLFQSMNVKGMNNYSLEYVPAELDVTSIIEGSEKGKKILQFVISSQLSNNEFGIAASKVKELAENTQDRWIVKEPFAFITNNLYIQLNPPVKYLEPCPSLRRARYARYAYGPPLLKNSKMRKKGRVLNLFRNSREHRTQRHVDCIK